MLARGGEGNSICLKSCNGTDVEMAALSSVPQASAGEKQQGDKEGVRDESEPE